MNCSKKCIYLSPSVQEYNLYNGPGNEEEYMNLVADSVERYLEEYGICFTRNNPSMILGEIVEESNKGEYILHLAIHSNAAGEGASGEIQGSEVYYFPTSQEGFKLASITANNIKSIYPYPEKVSLKTSTSFSELRRTKAPAILVEIAYHDNVDDAEWIRNNTDEIGRILALSVKEYIDSVCECPAGANGEVITMGGNLNIRKEPSFNSEIITKLENGTKVKITDCDGKWYKINTDNIEGYAFRHYISTY